MKRPKCSIDLVVIGNNSYTLQLVIYSLFAALECHVILDSFGKISGTLAHTDCQHVASFGCIFLYLLDEMKCMFEFTRMNVILRFIDSATSRQVSITQRQSNGSLPPRQLHCRGEISAEKVSTTECGEECVQALETNHDVFQPNQP